MAIRVQFSYWWQWDCSLSPLTQAGGESQSSSGTEFFNFFNVILVRVLYYLDNVYFGLEIVFFFSIFCIATEWRPRAAQDFSFEVSHIDLFFPTQSYKILCSRYTGSLNAFVFTTGTESSTFWKHPNVSSSNVWENLEIEFSDFFL